MYEQAGANVSAWTSVTISVMAPGGAVGKLGKAAKPARARPRGSAGIDDVAAAGRKAKVCSFTAGTQVQMCDGSTKSIEEVEEGEYVLARDEKTGAIECRPVVAPYANPDRAIIELELTDADGHTELIETTDNHPFWVDGQGWTRVDELAPGDRIPSAFGGLLRVTSATWTQRVETVYNFGVEEYRSYFVGESAAWVHNCWAGGKESALEHFKKHKSDFPNLNNAKQYVDEATEFLNKPPSSAIVATRPRDGTKVVYDPASNRLGFQVKSGDPASYYKPDPSIHGEPTNLDYFYKVIK